MEHAGRVYRAIAMLQSSVHSKQMYTDRVAEQLIVRKDKNVGPMSLQKV